MSDALSLFVKRRDTDAVADAALEFVEQEVGRHDWKVNWPKFKENQGDGLERRIRSWLRYVQLDVEPTDIVAYLDKMVLEQAGRWR